MLPTDLIQRSSDTVKVGVIGLGNMGKHHVRVLSEMPNAYLAAVCDPSQMAIEDVLRARNVKGYLSMEEMFEKEKLDAVTIAVPTSFHEEVALAAIAAGVNFLVEKPVAPTVEAARRVREAADASGLIATVGHIERYNPAVVALKRGLKAGELGQVFQLRAIRTGPLPDRIQDTGVVVDLATHDLDVIRYLVEEPVERVFAETARRMHSNHEDLSTALMRFADGTISLLDVNWLTPVKIRELTVVGDGGMYRLDYLTQNLSFYENSHIGYWSDIGGRQGVSEGNMVRYRIERQEPLRVELEAFVDTIRGKETIPLVPLSDGIAAVALAEALKRSASTHRAVTNGDLSMELGVPLYG